MTRPGRIEIVLPDWIEALAREPGPLVSAEDRMAFAIRLAQENSQRGTGGPFGAAVFRCEDNALVAAGVNLVVGSGYGIAHAEVVALCLAQQTTGSFDLSAASGRHQLVTSVEPCAMCLGALCWSGITSLVCGARGADAEAIGFDEGPKPEDWTGALQSRGIEIQRDLLRPQAARILQDYAAAGGLIYNSGGNPG